MRDEREDGEMKGWRRRAKKREMKAGERGRDRKGQRHKGQC